MAEDHGHPIVPDAGAADQGRRLRRRELVQGGFLTAAGSAAVTAAGRPIAGSRRLSLSWAGLIPFFVYTALFLFLPTLIILVGSLTDRDGNFTLANFGIDGIAQAFLLKSLGASLEISAVSALVGAVAGACLAYAVATGNPRGVLRRAVTSAAGVLAQFGGVTLAFAFIATIGVTGFVYEFVRDHGVDVYANGVWLYELPGLTLIYTYFQIPLMVIVFLPAVDGIRPQWREATESLGGNTWHYWRYVAGPLLAPSFLGCTLLLFANGFSAYATAAALITQGGVILPLQIANLLTSETGRAQPGLAKALALAMILVVLIVMALYTVLQRRTSNWLR
ncbi:MAG TPA: ABC transporter permease [Candidatus Dormibacteraeota bacterium]